MPLINAYLEGKSSPGRDTFLVEHGPLSFTPREVARFEASVIRGPGPDDCWLWKGGTHERGYGRVRWRGKTRAASRVSVELATGRPVPETLVVAPRCGMKSCVRPDHLMVTTRRGAQRVKAIARKRGGPFGQATLAEELEEALRMKDYFQSRVDHLRGLILRGRHPEDPVE